MATYSNFEMLPDEIILHVCNYLRGTDVLYTFFDLNTRLNITIEGYCRYVNLLAPAYKPFHHVVTQVLPRMGHFVRSFVVNGNWKVVLPVNILTVLFSSYLNSIFPQLQRLTLKWFTGENLSLFMDVLENFSQLVLLDIRILNGTMENNLLSKILSANNGRLKCISFDEDCVNLSLPQTDEIVSFPNIEELTVGFNSRTMLPRLFASLPNLQRLYLTLDYDTDYPQLNTTCADVSPLLHLADFQLRSSNIFWTLNEIRDILNIMPSLQRLTLDLSTDDERLVDGRNFLLLLPSSITQIHIYLRYYHFNPDFKKDVLLSSWPDHLPVICSVDDIWEPILLFTLPFNLRSMSLRAELGEQIPSGWKYFQRVEELHIYNVTTLAQILRLLQHFRQLRNLTISTENECDIGATPLPAQPPIIKLHRLRNLTLSGMCPLSYLIKAAPNLDYFVVSFDSLKNLLDDEQICYLLQRQIIRLDIYNWIGTEADLLQKVSQVFTSLNQLIIAPKDLSTIMDLIVLAAITNWYDRRLQWIFIHGSLSNQAKENLRQWILDHNNLMTDGSFAVHHNDSWLTLWKS